MSAFFGYNISGSCGGGGDEGMNPKPLKKLSLGAESHVTITWKGFFFTQSQVRLACNVGDTFKTISIPSRKSDGVQFLVPEL